MKPDILLGLVMILSVVSCREDKEIPDPGTLQLVSVNVGTEILDLSGPNAGMEIDRPVVIRFSQALDTLTVTSNIGLYDNTGSQVLVDYGYLDSYRTVSMIPESDLSPDSEYSVIIGDGLKGERGETFPGLTTSFRTLNPPLTVEEVRLNGETIDFLDRIQNVGFSPEFEVVFSGQVSLEALRSHTSLVRGGIPYDMLITAVSDTLYSFNVTNTLPDFRRFRFQISSLLSGVVDQEFEGLQFYFYTRLDSTSKFPMLTDDELLTLVQEQTFKYFWEYGHPVSGLARERNHGADRVTSGGSGFGLMAMVVAMERDFIKRSQGLQRLEKILDFLGQADRLHGAWSHWLNGSTGEAMNFSPLDNGGDLVETSYMAMGLLTIRQYLDPGDPAEKALIDKINHLWETIEWTWYTRDGQNALYWHWSPDYQWEINMKIQGYNEALITYVMAASSPTYGIDSLPYHVTWARNGNIVHNQAYYGYNLPLANQAYGGPLFFAHYSFLGIDPRNLSDRYTESYWEQNVNHTLINRAYCMDNPAGYVGYSAGSWGLTASDGPTGYSAHSPTNDRGVITPTAALSSFPYTPDESMKVLKHFYYLLGDRLWGPYGFYDAFSPTDDWYAGSYLAIDQGPIIVMIENHRSQLLWNLFMSAPEVRSGLTKLGFTFQ